MRVGSRAINLAPQTTKGALADVKVRAFDFLQNSRVGLRKSFCRSSKSSAWTLPAQLGCTTLPFLFIYKYIYELFLSILLWPYGEWHFSFWKFSSKEENLQVHRVSSPYGEGSIHKKTPIYIYIYIYIYIGRCSYEMHSHQIYERWVRVYIYIYICVCVLKQYDLFCHVIIHGALLSKIPKKEI